MEPVPASATASPGALDPDRAFAELRGWRIVAVRGKDARAWLQDLVTADVGTLGPGEGLRSLLLTPTGRIRADLHVTMRDGAFLLLQHPGQTEPVDEILAPYMLSSDIDLRDESERRSAFAVLGGSPAEDGDPVSSPSPYGVGTLVVVDRGEAARVRGRLEADGLSAASTEALDGWRIRRGVPWMGADFGPDALPAGVGLEGTIDFTKGCFLGQESVAKVRNLGHPPWILLAVRSPFLLQAGSPVLSAEIPVGDVVSVAPAGGDVHAFVRVRWEAASAPLATPEGPLYLR